MKWTAWLPSARQVLLLLGVALSGNIFAGRWVLADTARASARASDTSLAGGAAVPFDTALRFDATLPLEVAIGGPRGYAALDGLSGRRDYYSASALPEQPRVAWQLRLASRAMPAVAVDDSARTVVPLDAGRLVQVDAHGQIEWNISVGAVVAAGPVILSGGQRWVLTLNNQLICVRPNGSICFRRALQVAPWHTTAPPLPLADDDVVFALGRTLLHFDARGTVLAQSTTPNEVRALFRVRGRTLVLLANGHVLHWTVDARLVENGELPDVTRTPVALPTGSLVATVSDNRLAELVPRAGKASTLRFVTSEAILAGPISAAGNLVTLSNAGILESRSGLTGDSRRIPLDTGSHLAVAPGTTLMLADGAGRVAIARPNAGLTIVGSGGAAATLTEASCASPLSLLPAGPGSVILVCDAGTVWMLRGEVEKTERLETPATVAPRRAERVLGH